MLVHSLKWGESRQWFLDQHREHGVKLPEELCNEPELDPENALFYKAFEELFSCRTDVGIPWWVIERYADFHGIVGELREDLFHHVRALDVVFAKWKAEQKPHGKTS